MLTNAIEAPVVQQTFGRYTEGQLQRSFHHHRELIDAFRSGDAAWARAAMGCHVRAARVVMLQRLEPARQKEGRRRPASVLADAEEVLPGHLVVDQGVDLP